MSSVASASVLADRPPDQRLREGALPAVGLVGLANIVLAVVARR